VPFNPIFFLLQQLEEEKVQKLIQVHVKNGR